MDFVVYRFYVLFLSVKVYILAFVVLLLFYA